MRVGASWFWGAARERVEGYRPVLSVLRGGRDACPVKKL
jgi:hypothetical protein